VQSLRCLHLGAVAGLITASKVCAELLLIIAKTWQRLQKMPSKNHMSEGSSLAT
jgi:hypothetical protein